MQISITLPYERPQNRFQTNAMLEVYVYTVNLIQMNSFQLYKIALISPLDEQYYRFYLFSFLSFSFSTTSASLASCMLWVTTMTHLSFS